MGIVYEFTHGRTRSLKGIFLFISGNSPVNKNNKEQFLHYQTIKKSGNVPLRKMLLWGGAYISKDIERIKNQIQKSRNRLTKLWELKNRTDHEVLQVAEEVDHLMNDYHHLIEEKLKDS